MDSSISICRSLRLASTFGGLSQNCVDWKICVQHTQLVDQFCLVREKGVAFRFGFRDPMLSEFLVE